MTAVDAGLRRTGGVLIPQNLRADTGTPSGNPAHARCTRDCPRSPPSCARDASVTHYTPECPYIPHGYCDGKQE